MFSLRIPMVSGLPSDFPCPPKEQNTKENLIEPIIGGGVFVRSELSQEIDVSILPVQKRLKVEVNLEIENEESGQNNRVKFSVEPPKEFPMFPNCEYDRTSRKSGKWVKYTMTYD